MGQEKMRATAKMRSEGVRVALSTWNIADELCESRETSKNGISRVKIQRYRGLFSEVVQTHLGQRYREYVEKS